MEGYQVERDMLQAAAPLVHTHVKSKSVKHLQAWHYLIPVFTAFWIGFGIVIIDSNFALLAISALAVLALLSTLVIALAWAYQNNF